MVTYSVVLSGRILDGFDIHRVVEQFAKLVGKDDASVSRLLQGRRTTVRSNVDGTTCERYLARLRAIGVECGAEAERLVIDTPTLSTAVASRGTADTACADQISVWNPEAAATWSVVLSPVFGTTLHWLNWRALGQGSKAAQAAFWIGGAVLVTVLAILLPRGGGGLSFLFLIAWYFLAARPQARYVKESLGPTYTKRGWFQPIAIAILAVVSMLAIFWGAEAEGGFARLVKLPFGPGTPECGAEDVTGMIASLPGDAVAKAMGSRDDARDTVERFRQQMPLKVEYIRTIERNPDVKMVTCAATASFAIPKGAPPDLLTLIRLKGDGQLQINGGRVTADITYTAQITDNKAQLYVTAAGLEPLVGVMALVFK